MTSLAQAALSVTSQPIVDGVVGRRWPWGVRRGARGGWWSDPPRDKWV